MWNYLVLAFVWTMVGIQKISVVLFHIANLGVLIFVSWLVLAGAVDLVSDAQVHYAIPLWGSVISGVTVFLSWALANAIQSWAQNYQLRRSMDDVE